MSNAAEMHSGSESEAIAVPKKEKRQKKDKKEKKRKAEVVKEEENSDVEVEEEEDKKASKKRKREILPEEIEIDVSLPEPASKKAARKAKKAKTAPATTSTDAADGSDEKTESNEQKRSEFSVWIGNLPWSATKDTLRTFLTENAEIKDDEITRIHMPAPKAPPRPNWTDAKPTNKGFAYVDFSTQLAMYSAIALTETRMDRRPLLIKNSKNFEGRPDKPKQEQIDGDAAGREAHGKREKAPSKKIFVGNLGFETTKEDLTAHFAPCGAVENIHMATFEDTGKCKGFAWVTFEELDAAAAAVKGYVYKKDPASKKSQTNDDEEEDQEDEKSKKRKFKLNKLLGRDLRCEFAEDSTTRYQKRFGKEKSEDGAGEGDGGFQQRGFGRQQRGGKPFNPRNNFRERKVDPRTIAPGSAHMNAPRASAAIVKSEGKKTTFN
ncbi:Nucleolar protein 13 [Paraconiothyrium brasiliense]|uniref:Nucleolar protein 13 n=1 Tax=Paraconiothyrium brasiliense TaxID=300254 RepID=A0ABR3R8D4_9PLEO